MANIGLNNIWYSPLTEGADGTAIYEGAKQLGKAVSCSTSITNNEAKLYGDDTLHIQTSKLPLSFRLSTSSVPSLFSYKTSPSTT